MAFIVVSRGKDFWSWLIRWFTNQVMRKDVMLADGVSLVASWWHLFLANLGKGPYAKIKTKINHAFIMYNSKDFGQTFSVDIRDKGPLPVPIKKAFKKCKYIEVYEPTFDLFTGMRSNTKFIDEGYDWTAVIFGALAILWYMLTNIRAKRTPHAPGRNFCSEFVARSINASTNAQNIGVASTLFPQQMLTNMEKTHQYNLVYKGKPFGMPYMHL
jgi:hypothetical protein